MRIEPHNDQERIIRLQNNDVKAFDELYAQYHSAIYKNILKLLKDTNEAENILQEVFITLWVKRATLDPAKPVANWLFVVSYNKSITHLKKTLKTALTFKQAEHEWQNPDEVDVFLKEAKLQLIEQACLGLSPQKKMVFDLCKIQGKTYEETALEMNISKHTVKEYLSAAVKSIKEYVDQHPDSRIASAYLLIMIKLIIK
jgi:RNA polymerase sigma factor (sigma-70 family)